MSKKQLIKALFFGFLTWAIPLAFSFLFYDRSGHLNIDYQLFKSLLIVVGGLVGLPLTVKYFLTLKSNYLGQGVMLGVLWFGINIMLDAIVLVPWLKISFMAYMAQIGLRYLSMPMTTIAVGYLLQKRKV